MTYYDLIERLCKAGDRAPYPDYQEARKFLAMWQEMQKIRREEMFSDLKGSEDGY